jgi:phosphonatase-like hydrolase
MRLRLAVFDMVGTTVRAGDEVPESFRVAFRRFGVELPDEALTAVRGRSKAEAVADLVATFLPGVPDGAAVARGILATFKETLRARYATGAMPVPGADEVLGRLQQGGVSVVLTTGLDAVTTTGLLQHLGWGRLGLSGVVTGDDVERGRPAPDLIHAAMRLVGETDPRAVLAVGDTAADLDAAFAAGVGWSVGVLTGAHSREILAAHPHTAILDSVLDLPGWLRES